MRRGSNSRLVRRDVMPTDSEFGQGRRRYDGPFHFSLPQKARLRNPCLRNEVSPFSQEGQPVDQAVTPYRAFVVQAFPSRSYSFAARAEAHLRPIIARHINAQVGVGNLASATELSSDQAMYREPDMSNSQKRSATRANRSPSGRPEVKRLPDRRGAQDQARGPASAPSCRRFRLAHRELAERIRRLARKCSLALQHDGAQGDCDRPYSQDLTTKSKISKARSERAYYN
jgi:hypothetical protein